MKEILIGYLSKTLNMPAEKIADLLYQKSDYGKHTDTPKDDALAQLLALDADRVNKLKPDTKEIFNNGYKKAEGEIAGRWEKTLREKFGVDPENKLQGEALADAIKATMADANAKPEKIKVHPEYLALEANMRKSIAEKEAEFKAQIDKIKAEAEQEKTWSEVLSDIKKTVYKLNPVLPEDATKAERQIELFAAEFRGYQFQPDPEGGFIPMKSGERVQDKHGYARKLSDLVEEKAAFVFDIKAQGAAGNAGNKNGNGGKMTTQRFKSENEYLEAYNNAADFAAKDALYQAWTAQNAAN